MIAWLNQMIARIRSLFLKRDLDLQFEDELSTHVDMLTEENIGRGMSPDSARRNALLHFGNRDAAMELHRDTRGIPAIDHFIQDSRYSARQLWRNPLFALTAALSLAIGIAANTTVFTVANAVLFRKPAGVSEPGRLVQISRTKDGDYGVNEISYPDYLDIRQRATTLDDVYAYELTAKPMSLAGTDGAERVFGNTVTSNYFAVLGVRPAAGRLFTPDTDETPAVVLSHSFWTRRFQRDPRIVGQIVQLNGKPITIIGVAAEGFEGMTIVGSDVWVAINLQNSSWRLRREFGSLLLGGRLKPGVSMRQAGAELDSIGQALASEYPEQLRGTGLRIATPSSIPASLTLPIAGLFLLLMALVSLVLIIACANVAGVLLARATARRREIAVRVAIGAGRARLIRQLLTETAMLFFLSGAVGLLLSRGLTGLVASLLPMLPVPIHLSLGLDFRVVAFVLGLSLAAAILSGLTPALHASRHDVISALKDGAERRQAPLRLRNVFVVCQVALSIVLVVIAGLVMQRLEQMSSINPGFDPRGVELASLDLSLAGYTDTTGRLFAREILSRVRTMPGVQAASLAANLPLSPAGMSVGVLTLPGVPLPNGQQSLDANQNIVETDYFGTMKIPVVKGRDFSTADTDGVQPVAIVSEEAARRFWPGQEPVGQQLRIERAVSTNGTVPVRVAATMIVVGIARDVKPLASNTMRPVVYLPLQQQYIPNLMIVARNTNGRRMATELRGVLASMNSSLAILTAQTVEDAMALNLMPQRIAAAVSATLGIIGLMLAAVGIYGVTANAVASRTKEIGIRVALGASQREIIRMVLRQGMSLVALGAAIGLTLGATASLLMTRLFAGFRPLDPVTFGGTAVLFAIVGLTACYVPVLRAMRINAMEALKHD